MKTKPMLVPPSESGPEPKTWGVIKVGKARFYWVAEYPSRYPDDFWGSVEDTGRVFAEGFAATKEEAESLARAACDAAPGLCIGGGGGDMWMRRRYKSVHARKPNPSASTDARPRGLLGSLWDSSGQEWPITKITDKRVWIWKDRLSWRDAPRDDQLRALDREALERDGRVRQRQQHWSDSYFYTEAGWKKEQERWEENARRNGTAHEFELLDLPDEFTSIDVIRAFRIKAHEMHPDKGGDAEAFRRLVAEKGRALDRALQDAAD